MFLVKRWVFEVKDSNALVKKVDGKWYIDGVFKTEKEAKDHATSQNFQALLKEIKHIIDVNYYPRLRKIHSEMSQCDENGSIFSPGEQTRFIESYAEIMRNFLGAPSASFRPICKVEKLDLEC